MHGVSTRPACLMLAALLTGCLHVAPAPLSPEESASRFDARSLADPALQAYLAEALGHPVEPWPRTRWSLDDLTLVAIHFHPALRVARADLEVAKAHEERAAQRPNPTISFQPMNIVDPGSGKPPWVAQLNFDWTIETGGKRASRRAVAAAGTHMAAANLESMGWQIRGELTQAAFALEAAAKRADQRARILALLAQRLAAIERRVDAGSASRSVVATERLAWQQARADVAQGAHLAEAARTRLAAALGLPLAAIRGLTIDEPEQSEWTPAAELDSAAARRAATLGRSDLLASLAQYDAAEANLRLELANQYPNLSLGPTYRFDQSQNRWGVTLALSLPLLNRNEGGIAEALAARTQAAARFEAVQTLVLAEVDGASSALETARAGEDAALATVADAEEQAARSMVALEAGALDRATFLASELAVEHARLLAVDAREQVQLALARLELAVRPDGSRVSILASRTGP